MQAAQLLKRCEPGGRGKGAAAWNACALLFTDKAETAPLLKSLANQYDGRIAFGEVRGSNRQLSQQFGVDKCASFPLPP